MWQSFMAIGRGTLENSWRKKKKHHGQNISLSGTVVPGGLKTDRGTYDEDVCAICCTVESTAWDNHTTTELYENTTDMTIVTNLTTAPSAEWTGISSSSISSRISSTSHVTASKSTTARSMTSVTSPTPPPPGMAATTYFRYFAASSHCVNTSVILLNAN